jgi:hypothetical protein
MWTREYMRQELATEMGYTDNVYFRHCWRWHELHPHSWIHDWEATHDHDVLKYREEKRTELIALGHRDKEQFNRFWAWLAHRHIRMVHLLLQNFLLLQVKFGILLVI